MFLCRHTIETIKVINSATGTANHTPFTSQIRGKVSSKSVISPNVRKKDIVADIFPLERAVKIAEVKIFIPQHKKLNDKIKNPFLAIL